jgi:hypothetical protein
MFTKGRYCGVTLSLRDMVIPKTLARFLELIAQPSFVLTVPVLLEGGHSAASNNQQFLLE